MSEQTENEQILFKELGIGATLLGVLAKLGIDTPTPIQRQAIPAALSGQDLIGIAQTGTGKTLAYGLPMLERIAGGKGRGLVLVPTRELAQQVNDSLMRVAGEFGLRTAVLIGGEPIGKQIQQLNTKPQIVIATPGRIIDAAKRGLVKLNTFTVLILDEADMMLDMGFLPQVDEIINQISTDRQTMLFSATMPSSIVKLARTHMHLPLHIEVAPSGTAAENVDQEVYVVLREEKYKHLQNILGELTGSALVFTRTKHAAKNLARNLHRDGLAVSEIHSNRTLEQRKAALAGFKSGKFRVLVATDIAGRGIDVKGIEMVVNYDLPDNPEDYVHRIGRTGRAGKTGRAISFAIPSQWKEIKDIEKLIKQDLSLTKFAELETAPAPRRVSFGMRGGRKFRSTGASIRSSAPVRR
ncbi:MAG: DEAD/DEAH box helicase [Candidatus Falkowbacteria bacterium]